MPGSGEDGRPEQRGDGRSSLEPGGNRRHGKPGVLSEERHESRDVRFLPQGHIAVKQGFRTVRYKKYILRMIQAAQLYFPIAHAYRECWLRVDCRAIHHAAVAHTKA